MDKSTDMELKIKTGMTLSKKTQKDLSVFLGMTQPNFNQKLKRQTFTQEELHRIAEALGATYHCYFEFPDGTKI